MNENHLEKIHSPLNSEFRHRRLEEVYVLAETDWLKRQANVRKAMEEGGLQIHAVVYDKDNGKCWRLVEEE